MKTFGAQFTTLRNIIREVMLFYILGRRTKALKVITIPLYAVFIVIILYNYINIIISIVLHAQYRTN